MTKTKFVFTLGPATDAPGILPALLRAGMDCARFNFSHGTHAEHTRRLRQLQQATAKAGVTVATLVDLSGPKIRVGRFAGGSITLRQGETVRITRRAVLGQPGLIPVNCPGLDRVAQPGHLLLLQDGFIRLRVSAVQPGGDLACRVESGGVLSDHQGMNLPGIPLPIPALTVKDRGDLAWAIAHKADYIALSFVRRPEDIRQLRKLLQTAGSTAGIIAKIEKPEALSCLEAIIAESDGVMIARGDLGVEMGPAEVPIQQKRIITLAREQGKFVITATQMLQSMIDTPSPTRAEASDIANAIFDGTDAVMLSGETAAGKYPVAAARMMEKIVLEAEQHPEYSRMPQTPTALGAADQVVAAGVQLAEQAHASALVVFTQSGNTARLVARRRPQVPIYALAHDGRVQRRLHLWWGVRPMVIHARPAWEAIIPAAEKYLLKHTHLRRKQTVVILASSPMGAATNFIKSHCLPAK